MNRIGSLGIMILSCVSLDAMERQIEASVFEKMGYKEQQVHVFKTNLKLFIYAGDLEKIQQLLADPEIAIWTEIEIEDLMYACIKNQKKIFAHLMFLPRIFVCDVLKELSSRADDSSAPHQSEFVDFKDWLETLCGVVPVVLDACKKCKETEVEFLSLEDLLDIKVPLTLFRDEEGSNPAHKAIAAKNFKLTRWLAARYPEFFTLKNKRDLVPLAFGFDCWHDDSQWLEFINQIRSDHSLCSSCIDRAVDKMEIHSLEWSEFMKSDETIKRYIDNEYNNVIRSIIAQGIKIDLSDVIYAAKKDRETLFKYFLTLDYIDVRAVLSALGTLLVNMANVPQLIPGNNTGLIKKYMDIVNESLT